LFSAQQFVVIFVLNYKLKYLSKVGNKEQEVESHCEKILIIITVMHHVCIIKKDGRSLWGYMLLNTEYFRQIPCNDKPNL